MTVEFPYLITNRISAPLELCGEESDEWQGSTQWPVKDREVSETEKRGQRVKPLPYRLNLIFCWFFLKLRETLFSPLL